MLLIFFYSTDIDILEDWKDTNSNDLKKYTENDDCSKKINELIEHYNVKSNVNFTLSDFKKFKKSLEKAEVRMISLKKGGNSSWQKSGETSEITGGSSKNSWQSGGAHNKSLWQGGGSSWKKGGSTLDESKVNSWQ